jgi:hypothetical protein
MLFDPKELEQKIPYKNNHFLIEPFGIYNFFRVLIETGETPKELKEQMFTSREAAKTAVGNYIHRMTTAKPKKED